MVSIDSDFRRRNPEEERTTGLFSRLLTDASALAKNEIELAKTEFRNSLDELKTGLAAFGIACVVLLAGLMALVAAGILALGQVMVWWLAALCVGIPLGIAGLVLLGVGKRKLLNTGTRMDRTQNSLQKDATVVARRTP